MDESEDRFQVNQSEKKKKTSITVPQKQHGLLFISNDMTQKKLTGQKQKPEDVW